jgi:hypothetical protein
MGMREVFLRRLYFLLFSPLGSRIILSGKSTHEEPKTFSKMAVHNLNPSETA